MSPQAAKSAQLAQADKEIRRKLNIDSLQQPEAENEQESEKEVFSQGPEISNQENDADSTSNPQPDNGDKLSNEQTKNGYFGRFKGMFGSAMAYVNPQATESS